MSDRMNDRPATDHEDASGDGSSFLHPEPTRAAKPKVLGRSKFDRAFSLKSTTRDRVTVILTLAVVLFPFLAIASLTPDLPVRWLDGTTARASLRPSSWMTLADFWFLVTMFAMLLMTRRYGADLVSHAQAIAWLILVVASFGMIVFLAPQLTSSDLPEGVPILGMALSWFVGPLVAVHIYDLTRGGKWWRAPLLGGLFGIAIQTALYFPIVYPHTDVPWLQWWVLDVTIKMLAVALFVGAYALLRRRIVPRENLGGRFSG